MKSKPKAQSIVITNFNLVMVTGDTGYTGSRGIPGGLTNTGPTGAYGNTGCSGVTGYTGPSGYNGYFINGSNIIPI